MPKKSRGVERDRGRREKDGNGNGGFQELRPDTQKDFAVSVKRGTWGSRQQKDPLPALGLGRGSFQVPFLGLPVPACDEMQFLLANQRPNCGLQDLVTCQTASVLETWIAKMPNLWHRYGAIESSPRAIASAPRPSIVPDPHTERLSLSAHRESSRGRGGIECLLLRARSLSLPLSVWGWWNDVRVRRNARS